MQDERKKLMIQGVLFGLMLAVGAFQLRPVAAPEPTTHSTTAAKLLASQEKDAPAVDVAALAKLPVRDPFEIPSHASPAPERMDKVGPLPSTSSLPDSRSPSGPFQPMPVSGTQLVKDSPPAATVAPATTAVSPPASEPTFDWRLTGVMIGARPVAIFTDLAGNQRLIQVGSLIDPRSQLVSVDKRSATVVFRGRMLQLSVGGDPNAK